MFKGYVEFTNENYHFEVFVGKSYLGLGVNLSFLMISSAIVTTLLSY